VIQGDRGGEPAGIAEAARGHGYLAAITGKRRTTQPQRPATPPPPAALRLCAGYNGTRLTAVTATTFASQLGTQSWVSQPFVGSRSTSLKPPSQQHSQHRHDAGSVADRHGALPSPDSRRRSSRTRPTADVAAHDLTGAPGAISEAGAATAGANPSHHQCMKRASPHRRRRHRRSARRAQLRVAEGRLDTEMVAGSQTNPRAHCPASHGLPTRSTSPSGRRCQKGHQQEHVT